MLIRVADPSGVPEARRASRGRRVRRWTALTVVALSLIVTFIAASSYRSAVRAHELALRLEDDGATATARTVEARTAGRYSDEVRATFDAEGRTVTALLVEAEPWGHDYAGDWKPLPAHDADEWPLEVRYLPGEPTEAMIAADVEDWTEPASVRDVVWIGLLGLVPAVLALVGWFVAGRPAWKRYFTKDGGTCWYCAHPKSAHWKSAHPRSADGPRDTGDGGPRAGASLTRDVPTGRPADDRVAPIPEPVGPSCTPPRSRLSSADRPPRGCSCPGWVDRRQHVVLGDDALHLWRGPRLVTIPRDTITAIRGDSTNLAWSSALVLETGDRTLSLPVHAGWEVADVPALREWADQATSASPGR